MVAARALHELGFKMRASFAPSVVSILLALTGCMSAPPTAPESTAVTPSGAKADGDEITLSRHWVLKGDGYTSPDLTVTVAGAPGASADGISARLDGGQGVAARADGDSWSATLDVADLAVGNHTVEVVDGEGRILDAFPLHVSFPLYVIVSIDWCETNVSDESMASMEQLQAGHAGLMYSHLFSPFHFTDPALTAERRGVLETWIKRQRDEHSDEIGVHVHAWCPLMEAAGVTCQREPAYGPYSESGRQTIVARYSEEEMRSVLRYTVDQFVGAGLGRPTSFRAGGWSAGRSTLLALAAEGFLVDTSAFYAEHIRASWEGWGLHSWNAQNWSGIGPTSQPYYPSTTNHAAATPAPNMDLLEVPDNACLVDYMSVEQMVEVLNLNAPQDQPLATSTLFQFGFHAPSFGGEYQQRIDDTLKVVETRLHERDGGPAVYARLSDLTAVWRR